MDREGWNRRYAEAERLFTRGPVPVVAEIVDPLEPGRALDLAAGEGRHALWLARRGWQVTAVDFAEVGIEKGRQATSGLDVEWVLADVYDYEPARDSFDLVLIACFHPRPPDRERVFQAAAEALKPGGHLLIAGRHVDDIGRDGGRGPSNPDLRYQPDELRETIPAGLTLLRCEPVKRTVDGVELTDVIAHARRTQ